MSIAEEPDLKSFWMAKRNTAEHNGYGEKGGEHHPGSESQEPRCCEGLANRPTDRNT